MDLPIVGKEVRGDGKVEIQAKLTNFDVEEGFPAKEIGVYALDPDTGEEILYAYRNAGDEYNFIPAKTGIVQEDTTFCYRVEIQDAAQVTAIIDFEFAYASQADLAEHVESAEPHPNSPTHYADTDKADYFWATAGDNHLHKVKVEDAKKILCEDVLEFVERQKEVQADLENYRAFQKNGVQVGYIIEDLRDDTANKVTSCIKGSANIGYKGAELQVGAEYLLTDGAAYEFVQVESLSSGSGFQGAKLTNAVSQDYNLDRLELRRSTLTSGDVRTLRYFGENFTGLEAGRQREIILPISPERLEDYELEGDWLLTADGFFSL